MELNNLGLRELSIDLMANNKLKWCVFPLWFIKLLNSENKPKLGIAMTNHNQKLRISPRWRNHQHGCIIYEKTNEN